MTRLVIGKDLDQCVGELYIHVKTKALWCHSSLPFEMAPKKNEYSTDLRSLVTEHFSNNDSYATIAKKLLIPRPTIQSIIKKTKRIVNLSG